MIWPGEPFWKKTNIAIWAFFANIRFPFFGKQLENGSDDDWGNDDGGANGGPGAEPMFGIFYMKFE